MPNRLWKRKYRFFNGGKILKKDAHQDLSTRGRRWADKVG